ncbi:hypothetical protein [Epibacterium sp. Ofav1-8]|uniref:hypothetical protein n=1 Tax=Epibacterium sp. Ofav1-8 TaxID=2917735 RepID=UPI001EF4B3C3|nr:hypothetical protein [Epibacterium sp. Ofav1-8]MCG7625980.1 hypothetical protein [Epibacterium sp. Ofav1-8]
MTVFVHLGAHKTGSTLLQNVLFTNRGALRRQKVVYQRGPGRHPFWHYFQDGDQAEFARRCIAMRERFQVNAATFRHVIFSSETVFGPSDLIGASRLYRDAPWALDALQKMLEGLDIQIIFYVRRQDSFIESCFLNRIQTLATSPHLNHVTMIRDGRLDDFQAYFAQIQPEALSWYDLVGEMVDRFGYRRVTIRPFETIERGRAAFVRCFLESFCDPNMLDLGGGIYENRSFSAEAMAQFLALAPETPYEELKALRLRLQEDYPTPAHARPQMLTLAQRRWLLEVHEEANRALFGEFVCESDQEFEYSGGSDLIWGSVEQEPTR